MPLHSVSGQTHGAAEIRAAEAAADRRISGLLPVSQRAEIVDLWQKFEAAETPDAVFSKSLN